ncbi:hypothetical protein Q7P35_009656 [Cladosporium inversicolor]
MFSWFSETSSPVTPLVLVLEIDDKRTFTSLERFTGKLIIKALADTSFDKLELKLTGTSRTYGRRVVPQAPSARTVTTAHRFLELIQPDLDFHIPENRSFEKGRIYEFPFEFAIPEHMLPTMCRHIVESPRVHILHTSMPPSFGDHELVDITEYAPKHASIRYRVVADVHKTLVTGECSEIAHASESIRFVPKERAGEPHVAAWGPARPSQAEISIGKLWTKPSGRLAVTSTQPMPFVLKDLRKSVWRSELSGRVKINLVFWPANDEAKPPEQIDFKAFLCTTTVSAVSPLTQLPSDDQWLGPQIDRHTAPSIIICAQGIRNIEWAEGPQEATQLAENCPWHEAPPAYATPQNLTSKPCYSAQIEVSLDATSAFLLVPTFHSCLITRAYDLDLKLSLPGSAMGLSPAMQLRLPVRVMSETAGTLRDSAVLLKEALGDGLGRDPMREDLGMTDAEDSPPGYQRTGV